MARVTAYELARQFHQRYEGLGPSSIVPWDKVPSESRRLMVEVAREILDWLDGER